MQTMGSKRTGGSIGVFFLILPFLFVSTTLASMPLSNSIMNAVVKISGKDANNEPVVGTGFLLKGKFRSSAWVITAAHLLQNFKNGKFELTLRSNSQDLSQLTMPLNFFGRRSFNVSKKYDLAAFSIRLPSSASYKLLSQEMLAEEHFFESDRIAAGSSLLIYGYPYGQDYARTGYCILRKGAAASYPFWPVKDYPFYFADFEVFPGYSGAPVFIETGNGLMLVGMVVEEVFLEELRPQKSKTTRRRHGLGLGKVLNSSLIKDFVEDL
ncbi:MAG: trypsin-like serine peptidase [Candidatus Rifleibacteriota bacterium]